MIDEEKNTRITVTIPKRIHEKMLVQAGYEDRSISNLAAAIIKAYYEPKKRGRRSQKYLDKLEKE